MDSGWDRELDAGLATCPETVCVVSPFIKERPVSRILEHGPFSSLRVITRFNLADMSRGVTDTGALRLLLDGGAGVRGVKHLHAKLFLLGSRRAIVTSANLTEAALVRNRELGVVATEGEMLAECQKYFEDLWTRAGEDLSQDRLLSWEDRIEQHRVRGAPSGDDHALADEGVDVGGGPQPEVSTAVRLAFADATQAFVKLFGEAHNRARRSTPVLREVGRSGCHWACTYPRNKRPRKPKDGALMFMGRLVEHPNDTLIFGRGLGMAYQAGRDDASPDDLARRPWKKDWPHYVRVHHAEFVAGSLSNGVSLDELMTALGANAFVSTQRNARSGTGNMNPRLAYRQQAAVELSVEGREWLLARLDEALEIHGALPRSALQRLDWPAV